MPQSQADSISELTAAREAAAKAHADSIKHVNDSIHTADSIARAHGPSFSPVPWLRSSEIEAPRSAADAVTYATLPPGWTYGVAAPGRPESASASTGIAAVLLGLFVLSCFNMGNLRRLFHALPQKLFSLRQRDNAFDEPTSNETRTLCLLIVMMCVFEGILTYLWLGSPANGRVTLTIGALTALFGGYYLFNLLTCMVMGWTFADRHGARSLLRGLNAAASLLSALLALPALLALYYPASAGVMLILAAVAYILVRIAFIIKGFRIFYINLPSLLYFILYLCALEIIPVIILYISARWICEAF